MLEDKDSDNLYNERDKFNLRYQCKFLYFALSTTLQHYSNKPIITYFDISITHIASYKSSHSFDIQSKLMHPVTIMRWYRDFNSSGHFKNKHKYKGRIQLPILLTDNPELKDTLIAICNKNLSTLSAELVHSFHFITALPCLLEQRQIESNNPDMTISDLLQENNLQTLHVHTVNNWLNCLGHKYCSRKQNYYNDKHKSKENIAYWMKFIGRYLSYEILAH